MSILNRKYSKGFTLIELLVVIAIIGVLATLILLQLGVARAKARDAKRIADVNQLRTAIELYFDDSSGSYPGAALCAPIGGGCIRAVLTTPQNFNAGYIGDYLSAGRVPVDPLTGTAYSYAWNNSAAATSRKTQYHIYTELERVNAPAFAGDADLNSALFTGTAGGVTADLSGAGAENACTTAANDCAYDLGQN